MIFDAHIHYGFCDDERPYEDVLFETCRAAGIDRACLMGLGRKADLDWTGGPAHPVTVTKWGNLNDEVIALALKHPAFVVPIAYFRLDYDSPALIDDLAFQGFRGLKFIWPREDYDAGKYFHAYQKAAGNGMVLNFHTGLVNGAPRERVFRASSARMRIQYVESVARTFPNTPVLASHFGYPEYEAAAGLARILPNFYLDIAPSGPPAASPAIVREDILRRQLFGRLAPINKLVFGSDCLLGNVQREIGLWMELFDKVGLTEADRELIFHQNAVTIYG